MLYLCLFLLGCSAIILIMLCQEKKQIKKSSKRKSLYEIPSAFWDEYNSISLDIYYMTIANCETIRFKIEDFEYKYSQHIDLRIYNERMADILQNYKTKKELIISKNK